jgi:hypothetical protein
MMASYAERGLPVTSPFGEALSEKLEPDVKMAAAVHKYREERAARMPPPAATGPGGGHGGEGAKARNAGGSGGSDIRRREQR